MRELIETTERWLNGLASDAELNEEWFHATGAGAGADDTGGTADYLLDEYASGVFREAACVVIRRTLDPFRLGKPRENGENSG